MKLGHLGMLLLACLKCMKEAANAMALQLQSLRKKIVLIHWVIAFVKDEGNNNFETMIATI
jgi:hypothetical protein